MFTVNMYLDPWVEAEEIEHVLHVNEGLSDVSVNWAEEVEGEGELEKKTIHHHQVTHCHCAYTIH